jgi:3-hydroxyacyl-CoA dehydrogenase
MKNIKNVLVVGGGMMGKNIAFVLTALRDSGSLGFKTGQGFMTWTPEEIQKSRDELNTYLIKALYGK